MLPVKADLAICNPIIGVSGLCLNVAFMLSYKLDMSSYGKSSHIYYIHT